MNENAFLDGFIKAANANLIPGVGQPSGQPGTVGPVQPNKNPAPPNVPIAYALIQKLKNEKGLQPVPAPVTSQYL